MTRPVRLFFFGAVTFLFVFKAAGQEQQGARATFASAVTFSRDGRRLASRRFQNGDIDVWDVAAEKLVRTLPEGGAQFGALAISPDGKVVASGHGKSIRLWEATTGRELRTIDAAASELAYSPDGSRLVAVTPEGLRLLDASTFQPLLNLSFGVRSSGSAIRLNFGKIAFSPDGRLLAAGSNGTIKIWEVSSGRELRTITREEPPTLPGHIATLGGISSLCFSPDGRILAAGGGSREVRTWDVNTGRELLKFGVNAIDANVIGFSPDGRTLVTQEVFLGRGIEPVITVWDAAGGKVLGRIPVEHAMSRAVAVMPKADRLAVASEKGLQIWDIQKRKLLTILTAASASTPSRVINGLSVHRAVLVKDQDVPARGVRDRGDFRPARD
jgi:WD40 repeat protein